MERANILPPKSSMKAVDAVTLQANILACPLKDKYAVAEDRESAYELLQEQQEAEEKAEAEEQEKAEKEAEKAKKEKEKAKAKKTSSSSRKKNTVLNKALTSTANTIGREVGKKIVRGLFDTFFKK